LAGIKCRPIKVPGSAFLPIGDSRTQDVYEAFTGGQASVARMLTESTLETPALRERIRKLAGRS